MGCSLNGLSLRKFWARNRAVTEVAKDLWDIIQKRFSIKSGAHLQQLRNQLASCKQQGTSVDDYFGRLSKLWDGIAECTNSKRCTCNKCECDLNTAGDKELEVLKVHDFRSGLDDAFHGVVRSLICAIAPLVYQIIVQNETIRSGVVKDAEIMSFGSQISASSPSIRDDTRSRSSNRDAVRFVPGHRDPSRVCSGCGRSGHEVSGCFKIKAIQSGGKTNHVRTKLHNMLLVKVVDSHPRQTVPKLWLLTLHRQALMLCPHAPLTEADRQGLSGFSDAQWHTIQNMFSSSNISDRLSGKNNGDFWIVDTGATHHMTGQVDLLQDIRPISPVFVKKPAGEQVLSSQQGTIFLTPTLCLKNVYLVPDFHINLISFGQLASDNSVVAQITDRLLILQDRTTRMLIGAGDREREGLYRFREIETLTSNQAVVDEASTDIVLWHRRLGHPSSHVLGKVPGISSSSINNLELLHDSCEICFRQCFPDSLINAKEIFDLIHCDLWGPYRTPAFCGSRYFLTIVDDCSRAV